MSLYWVQWESEDVLDLHSQDYKGVFNNIEADDEGSNSSSVPQFVSVEDPYDLYMLDRRDF